MKQNITPSQLRELSVSDRQILRDWWKPVEGDLWIDTAMRDDTVHYAEAKTSKKNNTTPNTALPLVSLGQMIQFLGDIQLHNDGISWVVISDRRIYMPRGGGTELCDSMWEAMKGEIGLLQKAKQFLNDSGVGPDVIKPNKSIRKKRLTKKQSKNTTPTGSRATGRP